MKVKLSGARIIMECLKEQGVDTVFGFPGGTVIPIYDALYHYPEIGHILTCHEQHAAHAADGYARATGKPGVVIATSGPGATNLVTGIATAYMDSIPMVAITGNVDNANLGKDSFQEIDITGVTIPITKHNFIVQKVEELADTVRRAFKIAQSGRPGPVLIDVTKDITIAEYEYTAKKPEPITRESRYSTEDILEAALAINESERPYIMAGGGIIPSDAEKELRELAKKIAAPVTTTLMGIGTYPASCDKYTGMIGMHGTKTSALCATHCDLLITIGARFSDRVISDRTKFAKQAKILHIDIDAAEINKNITATYEVTGDAKSALLDLLPHVKEKKDTDWLSKALEWKEKYPLDRASKNARYPKKVIQAMQQNAPEDTIFVTEVGQHQMWAAQFLKIDKPRQFLTSGGLGTMGFGLGASMGAALGTGKPVVNIAGDGCFHMNMQEVVTAVQNKLPIKILVLNNNVLGMVRQWQKIMFDERYSQTTLNRPTDYVKLAEAMGATGIDITDMNTKNMDAAFKKAFEIEGPVIIRCDIHEDENVLPMVPGGKSFDNIILDWEK